MLHWRQLIQSKHEDFIMAALVQAQTTHVPQIPFPTGGKYETFKTILAGLVCKKLRETIANCTHEENFYPNEFYAFYSTDIAWLKLGMQVLTPTEKRAYKVILEKAFLLLNKNDQFKVLLPNLKQAKMDVKAVKIVSLVILQSQIVDNKQYAHFCEPRYLKLWV